MTHSTPGTGLLGRIAALSTAQKAIAGVVAVVVVAAVGTGIGLATSGGGSKKPSAAPASSAASSPTPTPTSTPTPTPTPSTSVPPPPAPVNPLTGVGPVPAGPVIGVKIDDTSNGRPQRGINQADIVYIEQAEGGLTRLLAVFASNKPVVEAVRSVRASDPELLSQYGPVVLVASGGGGDSLTTLDKSILHSVIADRGGPGFARDSNRGAPYNLTSNLATVAQKQATAGPAKSIGFTWSADATALVARPAASTISTKVGGTPVGFVWNASLAKYVRVINGTQQKAADGSLIATSNVIVQLCTVRTNYGDVDVNGNPSQYTNTIGSGQVVVFRNGKRIDGTWSRAASGSGTVLKDATGAEIPLAPGGAWVVLATAGTAVTSS